MDALALVFGIQVRVIGAARPASVREDEDAFVVIHERAGLVEIAGRRALLDHEPVVFADDALGSPRDFRHKVGAEVLDNLIESPRQGRKGCKFFYELIALGNGGPALDRITISIKGRFRAQLAVIIGVGLIEARWERMLQVVEHVLCRATNYAEQCLQFPGFAALSGLITRHN